MRVLVTGANGFLGSHLVRRLVDDHNVTAVVRRLPELPEPGATYVVQDLAQPLSTELFPSQVDAVIHQAALIDTESLDDDDAAVFSSNVVGTWRILNYAIRAGAKRFIHASTGGVYGNGDGPLRETDPHAPMDLYALTKAQAELLIEHTPTPFPTIILRYFLPYGLGTPNPIPQFLKSVLRNEPVVVSRDRGPKINPIHVSDAVEATVRALTIDESTTINIAGMETTTFTDLAEMAARRAGVVPRFEEQSRNQMIRYYQKDLIGSTDRMREQLAFVPKVSLERGLADLVDGLLATEPQSHRGPEPRK